MDNKNLDVEELSDDVLGEVTGGVRKLYTTNDGKPVFLSESIASAISAVNAVKAVNATAVTSVEDGISTASR